MEYIFEISQYDKNLVAQVAKGIRFCTEQRSREVLPGVWELTDRINEANKGKKRKPGMRHVIYGVLLLGMGIFLFVPGLVTFPEHWDWVLAGAVGILVGLLSLSGKLSGGMSARFIKDAQKLLKHLEGAKGTTVRLTANGMEAPGVNTSYDDFRWIMETRDTFLFVQGERMSVLQKKDLIRGSAEELRTFLENQRLEGTGLIKIS